MGADEGSVVTEDGDTPKQRQRFVRVGLVGTSSADRIRASGHARRIKQAGHMAAPDREDIRAAFTSCEVGAVHTWPLFYPMAKAMKDAAQARGIAMVWGGDWPRFRDGPHFELNCDAYPAGTA